MCSSPFYKIVRQAVVGQMRDRLQNILHSDLAQELGNFCQVLYYKYLEGYLVEQSSRSFIELKCGLF